MGHAIIICSTRKGKFTARWQNEQNVEQCVSGMKDTEELALAEVKGIMARRAALNEMPPL